LSLCPQPRIIFYNHSRDYFHIGDTVVVSVNAYNVTYAGDTTYFAWPGNISAIATLQSSAVPNASPDPTTTITYGTNHSVTTIDVIGRDYQVVSMPNSCEGD
jgi:hypothetical protein